MKKKLLMHTCCGPCLIAPYYLLQEEGEWELRGLWYNDNIHPYKEYEARFNTLAEWSEKVQLPLTVIKSYEYVQFIRRVCNKEQERCYFCYYHRLLKTAEIAKSEGYDSFSTTLLYSIYQKHDLIKMLAEEIALSIGIGFYYRDFRVLWKKGKEMSIEAEMYRQKYCGCIYSEADRYLKKKAGIR